MRALGLVGVVLALAIVGLLARKQLGGVAPERLPADGRGQGRQIQQQVRQSLDKAAQQRQPVPDDN